MSQAQTLLSGWLFGRHSWCFRREERECRGWKLLSCGHCWTCETIGAAAHHVLATHGPLAGLLHHSTCCGPTSGQEELPALPAPPTPLRGEHGQTLASRSPSAIRQHVVGPLQSAAGGSNEKPWWGAPAELLGATTALQSGDPSWGTRQQTRPLGTVSQFLGVWPHRSGKALVLNHSSELITALSGGRHCGTPGVALTNQALVPFVDGKAMWSVKIPAAYFFLTMIIFFL